jgi:hypothetical protein
MINGTNIGLSDLMVSLGQSKRAIITIACDCSIRIDIVYSPPDGGNSCGLSTTAVVWRNSQAYTDATKINEIIRYLYANLCVTLQFSSTVDNPTSVPDFNSLANGAAQSIDPFIEQMKQAIYNTVSQGFLP